MTARLLVAAALVAVVVAVGLVAGRRRRAGRSIGLDGSTVVADDLRPDGDAGGIVVFGNEFCVPCKRIADVAAGAGLSVRYVDVAAEAQHASAHDVRTSPTVLVVGGDGAVHARHEGNAALPAVNVLIAAQSRPA